MSAAPSLPPEQVVIDASAMVDLVARTDRFSAVRARLARTVMHAPAHFDAEVLSALGRLQRGDVLTAAEVDAALDELQHAPVTRHDLPPLLAGAWARSDTLRLADALYVELAEAVGLTLLTTDRRLASVSASAEVIA
ncbi:type II toxin-antitoxin system VapC family toxin [[Mycobacterium] burgundiense]|uniref:Ribonuclease VapC n=1 Tax=[Mycobacterium] burgundiense TaxID=3064286 RepID=A0ABN9N6Y4_9MYCO|nr:type II toxin-antitoxin system VapC family toxin [Mycolicibacterium sp. MU0053]CAJ1501371.1 type II toxin-antitoxin system VapC family toxin [Mycolicibacterium sp. MU0053]